MAFERTDKDQHYPTFEQYQRDEEFINVLHVLPGDFQENLLAELYELLHDEQRLSRVKTRRLS